LDKGGAAFGNLQTKGNDHENSASHLLPYRGRHLRLGRRLDRRHGVRVLLGTDARLMAAAKLAKQDETARRPARRSDLSCGHRRVHNNGEPK